jgi:hypothetical protein
VTCHHARENAAVALITRQPPDDDTARHLALCSDCAGEAERLAPLPALLDLVADPGIRHPEPPGDHLLERLLTEVRRRRRRNRRAGLAAAAVAAVAIPLGWVAVFDHDSRPTAAGGTVAPALIRSADDPATGIWATVKLRRAAWGSDLTFDIGGVRPGTRCRLLALTRTGEREIAGSWTATAAQSWTVHGSVAADVAQITAIQLVDDVSGQVLLPVSLV